MSLNRFLFPVAILTPALLLAAFLIDIARDLHALRSIDPSEVLRSLETHLAETKPLSFDLPEELGTPDASRRSVFVFGSSDLVMSDGGTFPEYLASLSKNLRIINFGVSGIPSDFVRQRVREALAVEKPDLVLLYYGHNDYNSAYQGFIVPRYFQKFEFLLRLLYIVRDREKPTGVLLSDDFYWFSRLTRPKIIRAFQRLGLLNLRALDFEPVNQLILQRFITHNAAILSMLASEGIPVVLVTPIGNLRAEPFGEFRATTDAYRSGLASVDYDEGIRHLKAAKDAEILTYDLRAKSPLLAYLRTLRRNQAYVLDMERLLEQKHFLFGYEDFLDYVHLNDRTHRLLARTLYEFLEESRLLAGRTSRGSSEQLIRKRNDGGVGGQHDQ